MLPQSWSKRIEVSLFRHPPGGRIALWVQRVLQFCWAIGRDLFAGQLTLRATGLVYVTILSIVPVIAISFSVLKGFGMHWRLEPLLAEWLAPLGDQGRTVIGTIMSFVENVQGDVLAGVGLALLFVTTVSMAERIEDSFNFVWRVDRNRNLARRFSDYLTVILLGPVVMSTAMGLIASIESNAALGELAQYWPLGALLSLWGGAAPYLLVCVAFSFVYWFIPNTRVQIRAALAGGFVGGIAWAASGVLFTRFVVTSTQTLTIYAGFAIAIIALIWLYLCWLTLLLGAQVSFYIQHPEYLRLGYRQLQIGGRLVEQIALSIMAVVARAFRSGGTRPTVDAVGRHLAMPAIALAPVLAQLETAGLLTRSEREELLPNRDPGQLLVRDILTAVREPDAGFLPEGQWPVEVSALLGRLDTTIEATLDGMTLEALSITSDGHPLDEN